MNELINALRAACQNLFQSEIEPELSRPDEQFGDFATNIALQLSPKVGKPPKEIAQLMCKELNDLEIVDSASTAGPGFINIKLKDDYFWQLVSGLDESFGKSANMSGKVIVLEHTDPNPFKEFHIGHAYSNTIGTSIGKMLAANGAKVHQVSYHGDVGLHIAMAIYGLQKSNSDDLGEAYAAGAQAYEKEESAKTQIAKINLNIYSRKDPEINELYDDGRQRSLEAFKVIYDRLNSQFEKNYFESEVASEGMAVVKKNTPDVFEKSEGAVIYDGDKVGLHKRVFITKQDLPTYEAKEIGLAFAKSRDYPTANTFMVITANEIDDYFRVLVAAIKEIDKTLGEKIKHISHGVVRLSEGKMSSRTGRVKLLTDLEKDVADKIKTMHGQDKADSATVLGAIKYEYLKHRIGSDFIFDLKGSINLQGNSGPYLQYAYARANSIIQKANASESKQSNLEPAERSLARKISQYPEVVEQATIELAPNHISNYLYELAQKFNSFYEKNRVIGDEREPVRLTLVKAYSQTLKNGLGLLNIEAPERM